MGGKWRRGNNSTKWAFRLLQVLGSALVLTLCLLNLTPSIASAGDSTGFRYGTDSSCPYSTGSAPYENVYHSDCTHPSVSGISLGSPPGYMGGYIEVGGDFGQIAGCTGSNDLNQKFYGSYSCDD